MTESDPKGSSGAFTRPRGRARRRAESAAGGQIGNTGTFSMWRPMRVGQSAVIAAVGAHGPPQWKYQVYLGTAGAVVQSRNGGIPAQTSSRIRHLTAGPRKLLFYLI